MELKKLTQMLTQQMILSHDAFTVNPQLKGGKMQLSHKLKTLVLVPLHVGTAAFVSYLVILIKKYFGINWLPQTKVGMD